MLVMAYASETLKWIGIVGKQACVVLIIMSRMHVYYHGGSLIFYEVYCYFIEVTFHFSDLFLC
jgi:hypothetical protein